MSLTFHHTYDSEQFLQFRKKQGNNLDYSIFKQTDKYSDRTGDDSFKNKLLMPLTLLAVELFNELNFQKVLKFLQGKETWSLLILINWLKTNNF